MEKEFLAYDITELEICKMYLQKAKETLVDVDDTDDFYAEIHHLQEKVNDLKMQRKIELEKEAEL